MIWLSKLFPHPPHLVTIGSDLAFATCVCALPLINESESNSNNCLAIQNILIDHNASNSVNTISFTSATCVNVWDKMVS